MSNLGKRPISVSASITTLACQQCAQCSYYCSDNACGGSSCDGGNHIAKANQEEVLSTKPSVRGNVNSSIQSSDR